MSDAHKTKSQAVDVHKLAEKVYRLMREDMRVEQLRAGRDQRRKGR